MGWTSYLTNKTNKEECLDIIRNYKGSCRKYVMKGNTFYALMTTPENQDWVLCLLTRREHGEFYYKDIQMNPYESSGTPMSILKEFRPSNDEDVEWLRKNMERATNEKAKTAYDFGDVLHCKTPDGYSIEWNGKRIDGGEEFYIRVEVLNPWASKRTKMYRLLKKEYLKEYAEDIAKVWDKPFEEIEASLQTKFNGREYRFLDTNYRVAASTMKNIEVINKEVA